MKNIFYTACAALACWSCGHQNNVKIIGTIKQADKQKIYLEQVNVDQTLLIDSTKTDKNGHFTFRTHTATPTFYNVKFGPKERITFIAAPEEKIELSGDLEGLAQNYWVEGSEHALWIKLLNFQLHHTQTIMDSLKKTYAALPQGKEYDGQRQQINADWDSAVQKQIRFSKDFILKHAISPASYYALYQKFDPDHFILTPETDLHAYKVVASSMQAMYPKSQYTLALLKHLDQINKNIQSEKIRRLIASSSNTLPEIRLTDSQGDTLALSEVKSRLTVLDFSVLSARDAAGYIREMKKVYHRFRGRGVQIYQVCLDPNKLLWEKNRKEAGIDWICVWDPEGLRSKAAKSWNIQTIPANYIINSKAEIVGKNLYGQRLEERLNDLLKQ